MVRVHVLTEGFLSPNGRAFLFPLLVHRRRLRARGVEVRLFTEASSGVADCDVLLVDSKFYRKDWGERSEEVLQAFASFRTRAGAVHYVDTTDSTGWVLAKALPCVDRYYKAQLLIDRSRYLAPLYGNRPYTDYYHREWGIADASPETGAPVADPAHLAKLRVSWNSGLADHSLHGPLRMALYRRLPCRALLAYPRRFAPPESSRPIDLSCRMGIAYGKETIAHQRREIRRRLTRRAPTGKLSRRRYFAEMRRSKVVVSPFGLGEITLKDFETFLSGALLVKPDVSHMETWPDFFRKGETMASFRWDLADLEETIDRVLADDGTRLILAAAGQEEYRRLVASDAGYELFCDRFEGMARGTLP